jgi:protein-disulfide isomerase
MKKKPEPKSNTPLLIIAGVLLAAGLGAWYLFSSAQSGGNQTSTNANASRTPTAQKASAIPPNAPAGATPPNQSGSPSAAVVLEEFADFQCGACAGAHPIMNEIKSAYGSKIRFVFRNYPLAIPAHDKAFDAAVAVEAAGMQGRFWDMQNLLFNNQKVWTASPEYKKLWREYAQRIGLDVAKWESDMIGFAARSRVDEDIKRGRAIGISGTPSLYVNGNLVPPTDLTVAGIKSVVDAELKKISDAQAPQQPANSN